MFYNITLYTVSLQYLQTATAMRRNSNLIILEPLNSRTTLFYKTILQLWKHTVDTFHHLVTTTALTVSPLI